MQTAIEPGQTARRELRQLTRAQTVGITDYKYYALNDCIVDPSRVCALAHSCNNHHYYVVSKPFKLASICTS